MSPKQASAARAWLGWSQKDLAERAHLSLSTVKYFENGSRKLRASNVAAIRYALEAAGIVFVFDSEGNPKGIHVNRGWGIADYETE